MPIGGLKEKLLAAHRNQITTVLIPKENRKDVKETPRRVLRNLRIVLVDHMDDVLREALRTRARTSCSARRSPLIGYRYGELVQDDGGGRTGRRSRRRIRRKSSRGCRRRRGELPPT